MVLRSLDATIRFQKKCFLKSMRFVMAWMSWYLKLNAKVSMQILKKKTKTLRIVIVCDELELHGGRTNGFFKLITRLNSFSFSKQGREFIKIELNISNVWERMSE